MYYCMNKSELHRFIDYKATGKVIDDETLRISVDNAEWWLGELGGLTYLLSQLLEKFVKQGPYHPEQIVATLYELEQTMNFALHECDADFVRFMLRNLRDRKIPLEDELVELQTHLGRYEYGGSLRFGH